MTDPFSFAAGLTGLVSLVDVIATKGYRYIKAVKDCEDEVRELMVELDVFGGVLQRLARWVKEDDDESQDLDTTLENDYVYECQKTLKEINRILVQFERNASKVASNSTDPSSLETQPSRAHSVNGNYLPSLKLSKNIFCRLSRQDLKWPLSKSKTAQLIAKLERHKATCILALSKDEMSAIHGILSQQRITNKQLGQICSDQKRVLEMSIAQTNGELVKDMLNWLSPVNPAENHRIARSLYHKGTGKWFLDSTEFLRWIGKKNSALWIYGIPGAGKTILASLIIEEIFKLKDTGVAFYYCDYKNETSQKPCFVLGSLVSQLALQKPEALIIAKSFYEIRNSKGRPSKLPTEESLGRLLQQMSKSFSEVTIVVDGLDECGASPGIDRTKLVRVLSDLNNAGVGSIRIVIASRKEADIENQLSQFTPVSVAAMSSDLELYVAAEVACRSKAGQLRIRDENLRGEIIEALTNGAEGMFQWVKCQLDYLCTLPHDSDRRKALRELPPDLPATYIRILERIDRKLPPQTQRYIHRTLKWLALMKNPYAHDPQISAEGLAHAVSIDRELCSLDFNAVPDSLDLQEWCSSLVRTNIKTRALELSHFTVKEFLLTKEESIPSPIARKYLVNKTRDALYLAETCLSYLTLESFKRVLDVTDDDSINKIDYEFPFYCHAAATFTQYLADIMTCPDSLPFRRFFTVDISEQYFFWSQYIIALGVIVKNAYKPGDGDMWLALTPLQLASSQLLVETTQRLLSEGADLNTTSNQPTCLHFAVAPVISIFRLFGNIEFWSWEPEISNQRQSLQLQLIQCLISAGLAVNAPSPVSPLCLAILHGLPHVCQLLLENGAKVTPDAEGLGEDYQNLSIISSLGLFDYHKMKQIFDILKALPCNENELFRSILKDIKKNAEKDDSEEFVTVSEGEQKTSDYDLMLAVKTGNTAAVKRLLNEGARIEILSRETAEEFRQEAIHPEYVAHNSKILHLLISGGLLRAEDKNRILYEACSGCNEDAVVFLLSNGASANRMGDDGTFPMHQAVMKPNRLMAQSLLEHGAEVDSRNNDAETPLHLASASGAVGNVRLLLENKASLDAEAVGKRTPLHYAANCGWRVSCAELLKFGADHSVRTEEGATALHLATLNNHYSVVQLLLESGVDVRAKDLYGRSAFHLACLKGHERIFHMFFNSDSDVEWANFVGEEGWRPLHYAACGGHFALCKVLLEEGAVPESRNNTRSTPLHLAAKRGHINVMGMLLEAKANIDSSDMYGNTALIRAVECGRQSAIDLLLDAGADVNFVNNRGESALHFAVRTGQFGIARSLLVSGSDANLANNGGLTALDYAEKDGFKAMAQLLIDHRAKLGQTQPNHQKA